jgi:O-antigen/teichoic acid export membrane protein
MIQILRTKIFRWSKKGSIAILDQVLFNGVHFLVAILLARWLEPAQYGIFAVTYSILLLFGAFHMAILIEPMLIFGPGKYEDKFNKYLGILINGNFCITLLGSFVLIIIGIFIGNLYGNIKIVLLGLAVSLPFTLLLWLLRRAFYVKLDPNWSVIGGVIYVGLLLSAVFFLHYKDQLSVTTFYLSMGLCSLIISLFFIYILKPKLFFTFNFDLYDIRYNHFRYGRWALGTNILKWGVNNIYFVILPTLVGVKGVATLRALLNLSTPAVQTNSALSFLLLPIFSRCYSENRNRLVASIKLSLGIFLFFTIIYFSILLFLGKWIMQLLYVNKYTTFSYLIPLVALLPLCSGINIIFETVLQCIGKPDKVFYTYLMSLFVSMGGLLLVSIFGMKGVLYSYNISYIFMIITMLIFIKKEKLLNKTNIPLKHAS